MELAWAQNLSYNNFVQMIYLLFLLLCLRTRGLPCGANRPSALKGLKPVRVTFILRSSELQF